jgi:hypothetical protein
VEKTLTMKLFLISLVALACATAAQAQPTGAVYSANIVGIQKVIVPSTNIAGGRQLLGVPFDANPGNLDQVVGTRGKTGTTVLTADNIIIYDPNAPSAEKYKTYYLRINTAEGNKPMWRFGGTPQFWATKV